MNVIKAKYVDFVCGDSSQYSANCREILIRNFKQFARTAIISNRISRFSMDIFRQLEFDSKLSPTKVEKALTYIEQYAIRLLQRPSFRDFEEIKIYNGFFQLNIVSVIGDCWEEFFKRMGYKKGNNATMLYLEYRPLTEEIAETAFDALILALEFNAINNLIEQTGKEVFSLVDILRSRKENVGDLVTCDKWLQTTCTRKPKPETFPIPKPKSREGSVNSNSSEWEDVYKDLRNRYGDKYYEGERGDFLKKTTDNIDSNSLQPEQESTEIRQGLLAAYLDDHGQLDSLTTMRVGNVGTQKIKVKPDIHQYSS